jgi:hypothetical protein
VRHRRVWLVLDSNVVPTSAFNELTTSYGLATRHQAARD